MSRAIGKGALAGIAGTVVMTIVEKLEQRITGRPSSYVPAHTAERLFGLEDKPDEHQHPEIWQHVARQSPYFGDRVRREHRIS